MLHGIICQASVDLDMRPKANVNVSDFTCIRQKLSAFMIKVYLVRRASRFP